jgi:flagellar biogenesis protein FliO
MIRLFILIVIILFFIWLVSSLFFGSKKDLNKKINVLKPSYFLIVLILALFVFWLLPRLGVNPLFLIQKLIPMLSYIKNIIPF